MTALPERKMMIFWIHEATESGARLEQACEIAFVSLRTYRRWFKNDEVKSDQRCEVEIY